MISERFLRISKLMIRMLFRDMVKHMLAVNEAVQRLVADTEMTVHAGEVVMAEEGRSQKLILMGLTPAVKDVVTEDAVHIMALAFEEEHIES